MNSKKYPSSRRQLFAGILGGVFFASFFTCLPANCQSTVNDGGVVVRKNPDGSIDTFDSSDPSAPGNSSSVSSPASSGGGQVWGVHGANKPYTRKHGGVVVRRNPDGSIETFDTSSVPSRTYRPKKKRKRVRRKRTRRYRKNVKRASTKSSKTSKSSSSKSAKTSKAKTK